MGCIGLHTAKDCKDSQLLKCSKHAWEAPESHLSDLNLNAKKHNCMSPPYPLRKLQRIALKRAFSSSGKWESLSTAWKWEVPVEFASHSKLLNF
jgi:hypothetical protein